MFPRSSHARLILSLGTLFALTPFSIDLYLSAFPSIAVDLGTTVEKVSLTISLYFIGFAVGQIFYGPLLDRFGRKPPMCVGIVVYILANFGCMFAQSLEMLLVFRVISALGGSAASVGALTMVRDSFPPNQVSRVFSLLMLVLSVSPLLAPSIGSILVGAFGWRPLFGTLMVLALIDLWIIRSLPINYVADPSVKLRFKPILNTFWNILKDPQFRTYVFASSFSFAGLFVYVASAPSVFMGDYGLSATQFGGVFAFMTGGMILGGQLNRWFLRYVDSPRLFTRSLTSQTIISTAFFLVSATMGCPFVLTLVFMFLILVCCGITSPNGSAISVAPFKKNVGSASALFGFLELSVGAVTSAAFSMFKVNVIFGMSAIIGLCSVIALTILRLSSHRLKLD